MQRSDTDQQQSQIALLSHEESTPNPDVEDVEANAVAAKYEESDTRTVEVEYQTSATVKFIWLGTYFFFSLLLTLYNKLVLGSFKFPWLLTCLHTTFASVGTLVLLQLGYFKLSKLGRWEHLALSVFSVLFTANIAVSNLSLSLVSLAFFQIIRTTVPIFTVMIYRVWFSRSYFFNTYLSLIPIIIGAGLTTVGEYHFSAPGLLITLLGVVLAAVKTVTTNRLMTGPLALPSIELLLRMAPLAAVQSFICAAVSGELHAFAEAISNRGVETSTFSTVVFLIPNGLLAFLLNVSSFQTNKLAGALTMSVCANLKQVLTVALGILYFGDFVVDIWNAAGMFITLAGAALYSKVELDSKRERNRPKGQGNVERR